MTFEPKFHYASFITSLQLSMQSTAQSPNSKWPSTAIVKNRYIKSLLFAFNYLRHGIRSRV